MDEPPLSKTEIARALAAMRRRVTVACAICGKTVEGAAHRKYCSDSCRVIAYQRRKREHTSEPKPSEDSQ